MSQMSVSRTCYRSFAKDHSRYRAVIFGTNGIMPPKPLPAFDAFEHKMGLPVSTLASVLRRVPDNGWFRLETGKISEPEFSEIFRDDIYNLIGKRVEVDSLLALSKVSLNDLPNGRRFNEKWLDAINCVKGENIKTAVLTNNYYTDSAKTKSFFPVDKSLFDVVVESCVVGIRKPDPRIYNLTLKRLAVSARETLFLDEVGANLEQASRLGMCPIECNDVDSAVVELQSALGFALSGYVEGTTSVPSHLRIDPERLKDWMRDTIGIQCNSLDHINIRKYVHGHSNPTYFIQFGGQDLTLRKKPPGQILKSAHAIDREFRIILALSKTKVAVPRLRAYCSDEAVIGTPFYIYNYVPGRTYKDPGLPELEEIDREKVYMRALEELVKIHSVNIDDAGLTSYGLREDYVARQLKRWTKQFEMSKTDDIPGMDELVTYLHTNIPEQRLHSIVHGDYRIDNLLFDNDSQITAVIDWELSTLGDPLCDLSTLIVALYLPVTMGMTIGLIGRGIEGIHGIPSPGDIVEQYFEMRQLNIIDMKYHMSFTCFRFAAILQGVYKRALGGQGSSVLGKSARGDAVRMTVLGLRFAEADKAAGLNDIQQICRESIV